MKMMNLFMFGWYCTIVVGLPSISDEKKRLILSPFWASKITDGTVECNRGQCIVKCNAGFSPSITNTVISWCYSSVTCMSRSPKCTAITCSSPPSVPHGSYNCTSHKPNDKCTLQCTAGYKPLHGASSITCQASGTWTQHSSCVAMMCPEPPKVLHGSLNCSSQHTHKYASTCTLTCDAGYKPSSSHKTSTCGATSKWSSVASCIEKRCRHLPKIINGKYYCPNNSKVHRQHEICDLHCNPGYKPDSWIVHTECSEHETWTTSANCVERKCQSPPHVQNGRYTCGSTSHYEIGSKCELHCNRGYKPSSNNDLISCQVSEVWSQAAKCVEISCADPPNVPNGAYHCGRETHKEGDTCSLQCNDGYKVTSTKTITCLSSSSWSTGGSCREKQCQSLPSVHNGRFVCPHNSTHKPHDICDLSCDLGYRPNSPITHTECLSTETWTASATCKEILCQDPPTVTNGKYSCGNKLTHRMYELCYLHCDTGFKPNSDIVHTRCLSSGTWSASALCEENRKSASLTTTPATTIVHTSTTKSTGVRDTTASLTSRISSTLSPQQESTIHSIEPIGCEICSGPLCGIIPNKDPLVTCPVDKPYCMNHVDNKSDGTKSVTKTCASAVECNTKWWHETSDKSDCVDFNPKNIYSYYLSCSYCCTEDGCNRDVVPARKTMFIGHD